jgi:hypothetical protein
MELEVSGFVLPSLLFPRLPLTAVKSKSMPIRANAPCEKKIISLWQH